MRSWEETLALHDRAVADFIAAAEPVLSWDTAPGERKWSAAQITMHLNLAFEAILREAEGGPPMALRTRAVPRFVLRQTIMRRLLRGGPFPYGAPAPRETRPAQSTVEKAAALEDFRRLAAEVRTALTTAHEQRSGFRFRHPYFGYMPAADGLYVAARHIDHHRMQITGR
jgi:hypothetical protein